MLLGRVRSIHTSDITSEEKGGNMQWIFVKTYFLLTNSTTFFTASSTFFQSKSMYVSVTV